MIYRTHFNCREVNQPTHCSHACCLRERLSLQSKFNLHSGAFVFGLNLQDKDPRLQKIIFCKRYEMLYSTSFVLHTWSCDKDSSLSMMLSSARWFLRSVLRMKPKTVTEGELMAISSEFPPWHLLLLQVEVQFVVICSVSNVVINRWVRKAP